MNNYEYKYLKYQNKYDNATNIIKKIKYISKIIYYKQFLNNNYHSGGGFIKDKLNEINNILDKIPIVVKKIEIINKLHDLVLEHDKIMIKLDSSYKIYNNDDDLIKYCINIIS